MIICLVVVVWHGTAVLEAGCRPRGVEFRLRSGGSHCTVEVDTVVRVGHVLKE